MRDAEHGCIMDTISCTQLTCYDPQVTVGILFTAETLKLSDVLGHDKVDILLLRSSRRALSAGIKPIVGCWS